MNDDETPCARMDVSNWTDADMQNAIRYGCCPVCGRPNRPFTERDDDGKPTFVAIGCSHSERDLVRTDVHP